MRVLLAVGAVLLLTAATPAKVIFRPEAPILGRPLTVIVPLASPEAGLAGLPDLGSFELLVPPLRTAEAVRLVVLPMRSGVQPFPSLPLQQGEGRHWHTPVLSLTVSEGVGAKAKPAPFKRLPASPRTRHLAEIGAVLTGIGLALVLSIWLWRRRPRRPPLEQLPLEELLAELQRRLTLAEETPYRNELLALLERWRFGPLPPSRDEALILLAAVLELSWEQRS